MTQHGLKDPNMFLDLKANILIETQLKYRVIYFETPKGKLNKNKITMN